MNNGMAVLQKYIMALFLVMSAAVSQEFKASVDKNPVAQDEQFTLEFEFSSGGGSPRNFKMPDLSKFLILSGPNQSTSMQIINGSVSSSQSFSYVLQPREAGKFTIGSATIESGGNQFKSNTLELTVSKASGKTQPQTQAQSQGQPDNSIQIGDNLFLRAVVDRSRVYQGEQITVTYKVFTRVRIVNYGINKLPTMTGFWGEDLELPQQVNLTSEVINGKQYQVGVLKKIALFPTQNGTLEINPMEITCQVQIQSKKRSNDIFDQFFNDPFFGTSQVATVNLKNDPVKVTVLPLPQGNVPESFHGAVGKFSLNASLSRQTAKTNEPISLKANISGTGNIKILEAPKLNLPNDFEQYDPKVSENITRDGATIKGTKSFEWLIVPRYPGQKKIPSLEFTYYDINQRRYVTLKTNEFNVLVEKGSAEAPQIAGGLTREDVKLLNQDIRFIKTDIGNVRKKESEIFNPLAMFAATLIPLSAFIGLFIYRRKTADAMSDVVSFRSRKAMKIAAKRLQNAKVLLMKNDAEAFYLEISRALWQYVSDKLSIDRASLSIDNVTQALHDKKVSEALTQKIKECLESCEFARFAPASSTQEEKNKMFDAAGNIIVEAERELVR